MSNPVFFVPYYEGAFEDGCVIEHEDDCFNMSTHSVGDIILASGKLVGADPLILVGLSPFVQAVPVGTFPVRLSIADVNGGDGSANDGGKNSRHNSADNEASDKRVAFARIDFAKKPVERWEMALLPEQDPDALGEDEIYGYTTDAGAACFMDEHSANALKREIQGESDFFEELMEEMDENFQSTWSWANMPLETGNIVSFMSGYGNGYYATYFGRCAEGEIVAAVTDFDVIPWNGTACS